MKETFYKQLGRLKNYRTLLYRGYNPLREFDVFNGFFDALNTYSAGHKTGGMRFAPRTDIKEIRKVSFKRSFTLPENVKGEQINAKTDNGILEVVIPKAEEKKPKELEIKIK